jgi:hypothetical protein
VTIATEKEGRQGLEAPIIEKEGLQHALNVTLKMMQMQLVMPSSSPVSILSHQAVDIAEISIPREQIDVVGDSETIFESQAQHNPQEQSHIGLIEMTQTFPEGGLVKGKRHP